MRLSARTVYGLDLVVELARSGGGPLSLGEIAERRAIPQAYLAKIIAPLKAAALVETARGSGGGVALSRPASDIDACTVVEALEGSLVELDPIVAGDSAHFGRKDANPVRDLLRSGMERAIRASLDTYTLAELATLSMASDFSI